MRYLVFNHPKSQNILKIFIDFFLKKEYNINCRFNNFVGSCL